MPTDMPTEERSTSQARTNTASWNWNQLSCKRIRHFNFPI